MGGRACLVLAVCLTWASMQAASASTVLILLRDGSTVEGEARFSRLNFMVGDRERGEPIARVLSVHTGDPATPHEQGRIAGALAALAGRDVRARDAAVSELTEIGLPAMTPLLQSIKDRDMRQPDPLYRLFARLMPGAADSPDRSLDLIRIKGKEPIRGKLKGSELRILAADGREQSVPIHQIRRLAVRQSEVRKTVEVHSLLHSTQIEYLDSGIVLTRESTLDSEATGYVRLDFNQDGWSSGPDGLTKPGPNYSTHLVDGFPFGALVGRIGPGGPIWFIGRRFHKQGIEPGRLHIAVNDNPHWQNNIGSFRALLRASEAYDLGEPQ